MRDDKTFVNTAAPNPSSMLHPLTQVATRALQHTIGLYEEVIAEHDRVDWERIQQIDEERQRSQHFLDWLGQILKLVGGKRDNENVVDAVARYTETATADVMKAAGWTVACREAFRHLCEKHNIVPPCNHFTGTVLPLGSGPPSLANCDTCGHPAIMHEPAPETEAAS